MTRSYFLKKKSETADKIISLIKDLKSKHGIVVRIVRCDNAEENIALHHVCDKEGLGVSFELTAPGTPQKNGKVTLPPCTVGCALCFMESILKES